MPQLSRLRSMQLKPAVRVLMVVKNICSALSAKVSVSSRAVCSARYRRNCRVCEGGEEGRRRLAGHHS